MRSARSAARFEYFRHPGRDPDYAAYDDTRLTVTVLSGPPGVGKDHWIAEHRSGVPVARWETPDPTEAHRVDWLSTG